MVLTLVLVAMVGAGPALPAASAAPAQVAFGTNDARAHAFGSAGVCTDNTGPANDFPPTQMSSQLGYSLDVAASVTVGCASATGRAKQTMATTQDAGGATVTSSGSVAVTRTEFKANSGAGTSFSLPFQVTTAGTYEIRGSLQKTTSGASGTIKDDTVSVRLDGPGITEVFGGTGDFSKSAALPAGNYFLSATTGCRTATDGPQAIGPVNCRLSWSFVLVLGEPAPPPVVFVHGFAGSIIACSGDQLYPDVPVEFPDMRLQADGETNLQQGACNPLARPTEILESFLTEDVYGPTLAFLDQIAPDNNYIYVWDWRKSPQLALDELDVMVEQARCGGTLPSGEITCEDPVHEKVLLMGHSMGGLVIRNYINDQSRADKVVRALTVGTPYWGSPKAIFPLAAGLESPAAEGLDSIIVDEEFQEWARNAQGLYHLYPSASFGGWLTVAGREPRPLDRAGLLSYVAELGGTPALLERALDDHAQSLDGFKRNGVDFQAFVGSGLATIERVLFFGIGDQDYVKLTYAQGDGTVPVRSGAQGPQGTADPLGEDIPIHYSCGIKHVPLPGDPDVTSRIEDFLVSGFPIVAGPSSCSSSGFQIEIYEVDVASSAEARSAPLSTPSSRLMVEAATASSGPMTLEQAELAGLIQLLDLGAQKIIVTDSRTPVEVSYSSERFELNATPLTDANLGQTSYYGPLSGEATISTGPVLSVADEGGPVTPRPDGAPDVSIADTSAPEGSGASFGVTLSRAAAFPVAVDFKTEADSATAGSDYSSREGTLVFEPGQQSMELSIPTTADNLVEDHETFRVRLSNAIDAVIADEQAVATIVDQSGGASLPGITPPFLTPPDTTVDGVKLAVNKTQKQKRKKIAIKLTVGAAENVTVLAKGKLKVKNKFYKLKQATMTVAAGKTKILTLRLKKSSDARKLAGALKRGSKVTGLLSATFTDELTNSVTKKAVVKLK
jgi:pimeloyl-ACP methyl ester carboxylesterase